eukprot:14001356-Alexandrium_andersonii.AAC.1
MLVEHLWSKLVGAPQTQTQKVAVSYSRLFKGRTKSPKHQCRVSETPRFARRVQRPGLRHGVLRLAMIPSCGEA